VKKISLRAAHPWRSIPGCGKPRALCAILITYLFMEYVCRSGFKVYTFKLKDSSVEILYKGMLDSEEYDIPFERIGDRKVVGVYASDSAFIVSIFTILFSIILMLLGSEQAFAIFGFIGIVSLLFGLITRKGIVTLPLLYGGDVKLYFSRSKKDEAVAFADSLISNARSFIKQKYSNFDRQMPLDKQFEHLEYLRDRDLLTIDEYNDIKNYLLGNEKRSIGFYQ
jgi:hypothetical protein